MSPHLLSGAARLAGSSLLRLQSDDRLVALIRDGHDPAFSAVVDRYRPELLRYGARLVGESRAEDVLQQAFLNAHMALLSNQSEIQLRPWLYRIVHNAGLNVLRASRHESELDDRIAAPGGVEDDFESTERLREAFAAIARLPEPQRDALTLRAVEGRSHTEIAAALGVTAGAARQQLHRARTTVRTAVSAVTPYGLMVRLAMAGPDGAGSSVAATAGAGLGVTATKVGAGLLAAGALGIGATNLPIVPSTRHHQSHHAQTLRPAAPAGEAAVVEAVPDSAGRFAGEAPRPHHGGEHRGGGHGRHGHSEHVGETHHGSSSSELEHHGGSSSSDDGRRSGSGDGGHSGSGDSGTSGSDSHSGSSSDGGGSSGGGGSGSDDGAATVTTTSSSGDGTSPSSDGGTSGSGSGSDDLATSVDTSGSGSGSGSGSDGGGSHDGTDG